MTNHVSSNESLLALENKLKHRLHPVSPDDVFVSDLRQKLEHSSLWERQKRAALSMLTIAFGLLVGLIIFLIGRHFVLREE
jgi:hypothetical protein